jgi:hypothetical protein
MSSFLWLNTTIAFFHNKTVYLLLHPPPVYRQIDTERWTDADRQTDRQMSYHKETVREELQKQNQAEKYTPSPYRSTQITRKVEINISIKWHTRWRLGQRDTCFRLVTRAAMSPCPPTETNSPSPLLVHLLW